MNPFTPGSKSHAIAADILAAAANGRWLDRAHLIAEHGASRNLVSKVRERLREEEALGYKGDYSRRTVRP